MHVIVIYMNFSLSDNKLSKSEWVSSFLTAHQHIIGYSVPYNGLENAIKDGKYNQGYLGLGLVRFNVPLDT